MIQGEVTLAEGQIVTDQLLYVIYGASRNINFFFLLPLVFPHYDLRSGAGRSREF